MIHFKQSKLREAFPSSRAPSATPAAPAAAGQNVGSDASSTAGPPGKGAATASMAISAAATVIAIAKGEVCSVDVVTAALAAIGAEGELNSCIEVCRDQALAAAAALRCRAQWRAPWRFG